MINEQNTEISQKVNETKSWFFEKTKKQAILGHTHKEKELINKSQEKLQQILDK